jgi:RNA polymerase sigma factor (sigma-70 family)
MNATDRASKLDSSVSSIYQEHFPMVFRFGFRLLGDSEQAMDLSQEVFLKLYAALNGGPAILEIRSWLFRTAANLSYDWLRRKRRYSKLLRSDIDVSNAPRDVENPGDHNGGETPVPIPNTEVKPATLETFPGPRPSRTSGKPLRRRRSRPVLIA